MKAKIFSGYLLAVGSAALVGLFTVLNKWLLRQEVPALAAAAWTYTAAAIAILPWGLRHKGFSLRRPWVMIGWIVAGSIAGPGFYFLGLKLASGIQGVLLINLEAVFTALLAFVIFKEPLTRITLIAGLAILAGGHLDFMAGRE